MKKHCATCTCTLTPLERLVEKVGQVEAAKLLRVSQAQVSRILNGGFTHARLQRELLALGHVEAA